MRDSWEGLSKRITVMALLAGAVAVAPAKAENWTISPQADLRLTYSDNVRQSANKKSDLVGEVAPGIRINGQGARAKLDLTYRLSQTLHASESDLDRTRNFLNALGSLEAIERWFFIDARASITQEAVSAFGPQFTTNAGANANRRETRFLSVSPYARGSLKTFADYEVRYTASATDSGNTVALGNNRYYNWDANLHNRTAFGQFGWALDYSQRTIDYRDRNDLESNLWRATLLFQPDPQWRLSAYGGEEENNYTLVTRSSSIYGVGVEWSPTERTRVAASRDRRFFGNGFAYSFRHRTPLSAWDLSYVRDVTTTPEQLGRLGLGTWYDLIYSMLTSAFPDPIQRAAQAEKIVQASGIPASTPLTVGFVTNQVFLDRRLNASFALLGARNSVTFSAFRSRRESVSAFLLGFDDFSQFREILQRGVSANWGLKLTPLATLAVLGSWTRTASISGTAAESTQKLIQVSLSKRLGPHADGALSLRSVDFDASGSGFSNYRENSITASLHLRY